MSEAERVAAAAEIIAGARQKRAALDVLPEAVRPRDIDEAYRVQNAVHAIFAEGEGGRRIGYKIGCTTQVMQEYLGIPNPCSAGVFAGGVHASGVELAHAGYRRVGIECEIAVRLARDLAAGSGPFTAASVAPAVESFMTAIEIVDDRYVDWRQTDTPTLIADDFFAAGAVLGEPVRAAEIDDPAVLIGTTVINGEEVGRGEGRDVMGTPWNALAWIANGLAARGAALKAGEIVLLGSLVETKWLAAGDRVRIDVSGLGPVEMAVA